MRPGEIWKHLSFYVDANGEIGDKYLLLLATPDDGSDIVARLLTSRSHGRPEIPACYHGLPYGGYFLGVPTPILTQKTWVDLRYLDDFDVNDFEELRMAGTLALIGRLTPGISREVILCVAGADDTTVQQERHLRDSLA